MSKTLLSIVLISVSLFSISFFSSSCQDDPFKQGAILYTNFCANCHMEDGTGLEGLIPPLAGADYVEKNPLDMVCIIRYGMSGPIEVNGKQYDQPMAGIPQLSEFEIANVINYINQAWGNDYGYTKLEDIRQDLENCSK